MGTKVIRKDGPGKKELTCLLSALSGNLVGKVGWFETAKYENGTPIAYVAAIQEFGTQSNGGFIPPRSFMRTTIAEKGKDWSDLAVKAAKKMLKGASLSDMLNLIGMQARGDIQKKISQIQSPPLAESTIYNRVRRSRSGKASTKPLVDTGMMLQTIQNVVEPKS